MTRLALIHARFTEWTTQMNKLLIPSVANALLHTLCILKETAESALPILTDIKRLNAETGLMNRRIERAAISQPLLKRSWPVFNLQC